MMLLFANDKKGYCNNYGTLVVWH